MMHNNSETSIHSAKALADFYQKKAKDIREKEAATEKIRQLALEQVALLKESNELARKAQANFESERARVRLESKGADVLEVKPGFFGIGVNFNEVWRRLKEWRSAKRERKVSR